MAEHLARGRVRVRGRVRLRVSLRVRVRVRLRLRLRGRVRRSTAAQCVTSRGRSVVWTDSMCSRAQRRSTPSSGLGLGLG